MGSQSRVIDIGAMREPWASIATLLLASIERTRFHLERVCLRGGEPRPADKAGEVWAAGAILIPEIAGFNRDRTHFPDIKAT